MDAPDLLTLGLTAHGAVALVVLGGGLPRYSERADVHGKAVQETEELLSKAGHRITSRLEEALGDVFREDDGGAPTLIVTGRESEGPRATYSEKASSPLGSDRFREAVRTFMVGNTEAIADYRAIADAHRTWCRWAQRRRWGVFYLAFWQLVCLGGLGVIGKIGGMAFTQRDVLWSFGPTGVLVLWFLLSEFMLIRQQGVIDDRRDRYHGL